MDERIKELIEATDPIAAVWSWIVEIGSGLAQTAEPDKFYRQFEVALLQIEEFVWRGFFDLYDEIRERCLSASALEWVLEAESDLIVFCDGLSIREALLLERFLSPAILPDGRRITAKLVRYRLSALPSDTYSWRQSLWQAGPPRRSTSEFDYVELIPRQRWQGPSGDKKTVVYHPWPDHLLHETTPKGALTMSEIFDRLQGEIKRIAEAVPTGQFLVTGDHGYLYVPEAQFCQRLHFKGARGGIGPLFMQSRHADAAEVEERLGAASITRRYPQPVMMKVGDQVILLARLWRPRKDAPKACHGGISLPECLVPVLRLVIA